MFNQISHSAKKQAACCETQVITTTDGQDSLQRWTAEQIDLSAFIRLNQETEEMKLLQGLFNFELLHYPPIS